ncbi:MAG TPA: molybdate ABC transporter substrate-binding protein [Ktedonobacteraceae bacterium]|nr:molybdate ABC transporter substrate-binding protein [Ktedonobacteraceae bacterium]
MKHFPRIMFLLVAVCMLLASCGSSSTGSSSSGSTTPTSTPTAAPVTLNVFGAASLTAAFGEIKTKFEAANPNVKVTYNFAGSNTLATQITQGAPADVFASADTNNMNKVSSLVNTPQTFARNKVIVIVPANNPANIKTLHDLAKPGVKIAVANSSVPVGNYTLEVLNKMGQSSEYGPAYESAVKANFVTQETSVSGVVQKVQLGEVDAGYVYVSDAFSAGSKVSSITIPDQYNILADYPIATVKDSKNLSTAQSFVQYVLSPDGQAILAKYHFIPVG